MTETTENAFSTLVQEFIEVLKREQLSPVILPFSEQLFSNIKEALTERKKGVAVEYSQENQQNESAIGERTFLHTIYSMQIDKISYLLKSYLRIRLKKIQEQAFFLLKNQIQAERNLTSSEYQYLKKYSQLKYRYQQQNTLNKVPKQYRGMGGLQTLFGSEVEKDVIVQTKQSKITIPEAKENEYVFAKILENPRQLRYNMDIDISNNQGKTNLISRQIIFAPYSKIKQAFKNDKHFKLL